SFSSTPTAPTDIYTLSLHDALPIYVHGDELSAAPFGMLDVLEGPLEAVSLHAGELRRRRCVGHDDESNGPVHMRISHGHAVYRSRIASMTERDRDGGPRR